MVRQSASTELLQLASLCWPGEHSRIRVVHLDVEDCSEELLRQLSYAIKNHLRLTELILYGTRRALWIPELDT